MQLNIQKRQISKISQIQSDSAAASDFLERQLWHFRGVASSLLGPHQRQAPDATTHNLTPQPHDHDPMNPLTLLETNRQLAISEVWRAPSRAHTRASWFSRPTLVSGVAARVYLKPSRASRFAVRGQPPPWQQQQNHPVRVGGNLHSVSLSPGLAVKDGGGRGEGGNQLFRPRSQRGGEKVKGKNLRKVRSRVVEFRA